MLSVVLRARPTTIDELARQVPLDTAPLRAALAGLSRRGMLEVRSERIVVVAPDAAVGAAASEALMRQRQQLDELDGLLRTLPSLLRDWSMGESGDSTIPVELVHGTTNQWDLWMRLMAETPPRAPIAVFPDFAGLATIVVDNLDVLVHAKESLGFSLRTITVPRTLADEQERAQVAMFARAGIEVRTLPVVPGWFYVDADVLAALPLEWGEAVPTSIALVREPAVLAPLAAYMESLWSRSSAVPGGNGGWDAILGLLAQGLSDGAIASALDLSLRTVRRRIAEAAEGYGAASRFALGVEWERSRQR